MEGPEGVKWNSNYFSAWEMGFGSLGLGNRKKMGMGLEFGQNNRLGNGISIKFGLRNGTLHATHLFVRNENLSFRFFFLESRDESTSSSS